MEILDGVVAKASEKFSSLEILEMVDKLIVLWHVVCPEVCV